MVISRCNGCASYLLDPKWNHGVRSLFPWGKGGPFETPRNASHGHSGERERERERESQRGNERAGQRTDASSSPSSSSSFPPISSFPLCPPFLLRPPCLGEKKACMRPCRGSDRSSQIRRRRRPLHLRHHSVRTRATALHFMGLLRSTIAERQGRRANMCKHSRRIFSKKKVQ